MKFFERKGKEIARRAAATIAYALMLVGMMPGNLGTMSVRAYDEIDKETADCLLNVEDTTTNITTNIDMYYEISEDPEDPYEGYVFVSNKDYTITFTAKSGTFNENDITIDEPYSDYLTIVSQTLSNDKKTYTFIVKFAGDSYIKISGSPTGTEDAKMSISSVAITGIDTPEAGKTLDTTATCDTAGVETTAPEIKWTANATGASGEAAYGTVYTAGVTLTAASGYEFSSATTATINGNGASTSYNADKGTLYVYYDFPATADAAPEPCTTHTYGEASYTWDGTSCTATRKCSVCGDEQKETVTATVTVTQEASCEQAELSTYTATFKNSAFATQTKTGVETKAALGHTLGDYTVTKPATIDAAGLKQQICSVCGKAFNDQEIAQLTDTYTPSGASGSVVVEAKPAASVPTTSLATNATDVVTLLTNSNNLTSDELTQVQNGATVKIVLDVADKDATMKADTANLIKAKADSENLEIGQYLDITLTKYINEAEIAKIKDLGNSTVTVSMILPDSLIKDGRTYYIIRQHVADDGSKQVDLLDTTYYKEAKTITFETSLFSDYAIAYKDSDSQPGQPDGGNNGGNNGSNGGSAAATSTSSTSTTATTTTDTTAVDVATTDTTSATFSPKTGEVDTTWLYALLFASLAGFFGVVAFKRKEQ